MSLKKYIAATGVTRKFGHNTALQNVDISLNKGDALALFGPNGAGKSTLIRVLCSLLQPTSGSVSIAGLEVRRHRQAVHRIVGVVGHQTFLYPHLTARENLKFYGSLYRVTRLEVRIAQVLESVGLNRYQNETVEGFSRGLQQRLSIGRAIIHEPKILFLDEPFTGLDSQGCDDLKQLIFNFRTQGKTMIMASHNLALGLDMCDQVVILKSGGIVYASDVADISKNHFSQIYSRHAGEHAHRLKVA